MQTIKTIYVHTKSDFQKSIHVTQDCYLLAKDSMKLYTVMPCVQFEFTFSNAHGKGPDFSVISAASLRKYARFYKRRFVYCFVVLTINKNNGISISFHMQNAASQAKRSPRQLEFNCLDQ